MKIAICDDELSIRQEMKNVLLSYFSDKLIDAEIYGFNNGEDLLNSEICFDMAFLDVEMPMLDGIETGKSLKQKYSNIVIFMITAYSDYLDDAFDIGAYRFLQKPLDLPRLYRSLDSSILSMSSKDVKVICANNESIVIPTSSIVYCESYKRKTKITTTSGEYISKERIDYWKGILNELIFYSPHSSFIINFNYIKSFNRKSLTLAYSNSNVEISIASRKQQEFRAKMFLFAERGMYK